MHWQIKHVGVESSPALTGFVQRKVVEPLSRMADRIQRVLVRVKSGDGRAEAGGCGATVQVALRGGPIVHVDAWEGCHYSAVDRAAERARRRVTRHLDRRATRHRRSSRQRRDRPSDTRR